MTVTEISRLSKIAMKTFSTSITFFYGHVTLILIALLPALIRSYQMWQNLQTPLILEIAVELIRVILFAVMITMMTGNKIKDIKQKHYWDSIFESVSVHMKESWPKVFVAELIIFLLLLFGLGNFLIRIIVEETLIPISELLSLEINDQTAASNAYLYFLKNITVIPLAIVYILKMCGVDQK